MIIFQKNFNEPRTNYVEAPKNVLPTTPWSEYIKPASTPTPPKEEGLLESALKKKKSLSPYERMNLSQAEQAALDNHTQKVRNDSSTAALNKVKSDLAATEARNTGTLPTTVQDVPVIDTTPIEEEALPKRSVMEIAKTKATVTTTNAKKDSKETLGTVKEKGKELAGKAKDAVVEGYNKLAENYGEGITGSLGTDAALAAGGLALAGGAYHLLKKRRAKKKAEKEALEGRIKK
jgi:hypothetical protein